MWSKQYAVELVRIVPQLEMGRGWELGGEYEIDALGAVWLAGSGMIASPALRVAGSACSGRAFAFEIAGGAYEFRWRRDFENWCEDRKEDPECHSDYDSDESVIDPNDDDDYELFRNIWRPNMLGFGPDIFVLELANQPEKGRRLWDFHATGQIPAACRKITAGNSTAISSEARERLGNLSQLYFEDGGGEIQQEKIISFPSTKKSSLPEKWQELPEDFLYDEERPASVVFSIHVDEAKLITAHRERLPEPKVWWHPVEVWSELYSPGFISCWGLNPTTSSALASSSIADLLWRVEPFSAWTNAMVATSLSIVVFGLVASPFSASNHDRCVLWSVVPQERVREVGGSRVAASQGDLSQDVDLQARLAYISSAEADTSSEED